MLESAGPTAQIEIEIDQLEFINAQISEVLAKK
jgi:hypothetical protein